MKKTILAGLLVSLAFQFIVLSGMYVSAAMPLWTGTEIKVKTIPVDPRSMFRGNYARLRYDFSTLEDLNTPDKATLRNGEVIYITLKPGSNGLHEFSEVSLEKPKSGIFLRGRLQNRYRFDVRYGIEAFFAPKHKAMEIERHLRKSGVAVLMVSSQGKARIKDIISK
jgi:uncharacterized membrane-anchored protein